MRKVQQRNPDCRKVARDQWTILGEWVAEKPSLGGFVYQELVFGEDIKQLPARRVRSIEERAAMASVLT